MQIDFISWGDSRRNDIELFKHFDLKGTYGFLLGSGHILTDGDKEIDVSGRLSLALLDSNGSNSGSVLIHMDDRPVFYPSYSPDAVCINYVEQDKPIYFTNNISTYLALCDADIQVAYHPSRSITTATQENHKNISRGVESVLKMGFSDVRVLGASSEKNLVNKIISNSPAKFYFTLDALNPNEEIEYNADIVESSVNATDTKTINKNSKIYDAWKLAYYSEKIDLSAAEDRYEYACMAYTYALQNEKTVPAFRSLTDIYNQINNQDMIHPSTLNSIFRRVRWLVDARKKTALEAVKASSWGDHKHTVVSSLEDAVIDSRINIVTAPTGAGKTKFTIAPFAKKAKINNKRFMAVAPLVSLISELSNKLDTGLYSNIKSSQESKAEKSLAVCLPSIKSSKLKPFVDSTQWIAVDEISQNLRFTSSKECKVTGADSEKIYFELRSLVSRCERVVVADASIDNKTIKFFENALPGEKFNIIEQKPVDTGRKCFIYEDMGDLIQKILAELNGGGKVWLAVESAERATSIGNYLDSIKPKDSVGRDVLTINSNNKGNAEQKAFINDPENESRKYGVVIASPVISSGISVEHVGNHHFTMIAGIASGHRICPTDFMQMLARVRYIPDYHVCLMGNNEKDNKITAQSFLTGYKLSAELEGKSLNENEYSLFKAECEAESIKYRSDFANGFYWIMEYFLFTLIREKDTQKYDFFKKEISDKAKEQKEKNIHFMLTAPPITDDQASKLDGADRTEVQSLQLKAYKARLMLGYEWDHQLIDIDIDMAQNIRRLVRFSRHKGVVPKSDDSEKNIALRNFDNAQVDAYKMIFGDEAVNEIRITESKAAEILGRVVSNRFLLCGLRLIPQKYGRWDEEKGTLKLKPYPKIGKPTRSLHEILEMMGLKTKRREGTDNKKFWQVTPDSWELMQTYSTRRDEVYGVKKGHQEDDFTLF